MKCHDCKTQILEEQGELTNGYQLLYKEEDKEISIFKCKDCFEKDKSLTNFRECEVYSRVVGYIRPVNQWNKGKQQEYNEREVYEKT